MIITTSMGKLAICPYPPLIEAVENWQFNTDIFEAIDSTEERVALRDLPRQTLTYSYALGVRENPYFFKLFYGAMRETWAVPLWFEWQKLDAVKKDTLELFCNTRGFSKLALLWQSPKKWQVVEIETIGSDRLVLKDAVRLDFEDAYLYPIKTGFISGDVSRNISGIHCITSATFVMDDLPNISEEVPSVTFNGMDLCFKKVLLNGDALETTFSQQQSIIDFGLGIVAQRSTWKVPRMGRPFRSIVQGQKALLAFKQWLVRRLGQYRPFYMPSYESNLRLISLTSSTLIVEDDNVMSCASNRLNLAIKANGEWYALQATKVEQSASTRIRYTLATPVGFTASQVERISYLGLYRLNSDSVDFTYRGNEIVEINTSMVEIEA